MIELCRRLGHEAFGEEDDEASDLSFNRLPYVWEYFKNIIQMGNNNSIWLLKFIVFKEEVTT